MNGCSEKEDEFPQLLDLIPKNTEWPENMNVTGKTQNSDEKKLELRLGLPGETEWFNRERDESLSLLSPRGYFPVPQKFSHSENPWPSSNFLGNLKPSNLSPFCFSSTSQNLSVMGKEASQGDLQNAGKKPFSPSSSNTAMSNGSQKRTAPAPVVGWPPIRSSRRNLAGTSSFSKPASDTTAAEVAGKLPPATEKASENGGKGLFVKINMEGVPIGRKVDLKAYDSYQKLSSAVDELFRGLLAAQRDSSANKQEEEKPITGLLDGSGEYTLVYEDNEGDRVLVGDVPWRMFISTVKRLRVLKSSELPALSLGSSKPQKMAMDSVAK